MNVANVVEQVFLKVNVIALAMLRIVQEFVEVMLLLTVEESVMVEQKFNFTGLILMEMVLAQEKALHFVAHLFLQAM